MSSSYSSPTALRGRPPVRDYSGRPKESIWARIDWVLMAAVLGLCALGAVLVWSATRQRLLDVGGDPEAFLKKHLLNLTIGLVLGTVTMLLDYRLLRAYAPIIYVVSLLGLVAVLSPLGSTINGANAWIKLPAGFSVQPSEFVKVAIVLGMAMLLAERRDGESEPRFSDVALALAFAAAPLFLIMLQPDLGTAMVICAMIIGMLAVAGVNAKWLLGMVGSALLFAAVAVKVGVLSQYQIDRFAAFANPALDPRGVGYNTSQARIAIGSGGLTGTGLFEGTQTSGKFVPEQQTDFVFTVAGEELGLLGAGLVIVLLGIVLWRTIRIAMRADDLFGVLVATGIACWFTFQAFENIGMTLGIMPVTGVPLPFVSYGGSSMFANMMAIGLLQNVHARTSSPS
jgi:rod shape determining protein RodA